MNDDTTNSPENYQKQKQTDGCESGHSGNTERENHARTEASSAGMTAAEIEELFGFPETDIQPEEVAAAEQECLYFPQKTALLEEFQCFFEKSPIEADALLSHGWRHFSTYFFRDNCPHCLACQPVRVPANRFRASKSQRRLIRKNRKHNITFQVMTPEIFLSKWIKESYAIYSRFLSERFQRPAEGMEWFLFIFFQSPLPGMVSALVDGEKLIGFGILDYGLESVSTVYFAFDPEYSHLSPGNYSIIREIEWAAEKGFRYYYLGYYIEGLPSMAYKGKFLPHELYSFPDETWYPGE